MLSSNASTDHYIELRLRRMDQIVLEIMNARLSYIISGIGINNSIFCFLAKRK